MRFSGILFLCAAILCAVGLFQGSYRYFKTEELDRAAARLTLYQSTVEAELRHFAHLPSLLSVDPVVRDTLDGADPGLLNARLAGFAKDSGVDAIYLMDRSGQTIAASNAGSPASFVGQNYAFRPYFKEAMTGALGEFYGIGATTGIPGYFYARAVRYGTDDPAGVVAIKLDLSALQDSWQASGERIVLTNSDGVVLLASEPAWRYRVLAPLSEDQRERIVATRQFGEEQLITLGWTPDPRTGTAEVGRRTFLYLRSSNLPNNWTLHFFTPDAPATTRAWLASGFMVLIGSLVFITWQIGRVRRIGDALARSEQEEAQLRDANERLAIEIAERRVAEQNLQKTQVELERAGRLAALGQLASSVTHELGQPIAAMRNQLAAAEIASGASPLNDKMQGLVARMENITRQLKFFSRKGRDKFEDVNLADVIGDALELLAPAINTIGATIVFEPPARNIILHGNRLRLEQVVTNIVRNGLDACEGSELREISIRPGADADAVWFEVADTGHGLAGQNMEDLREPFTTTRESGRGMGLGLTISAGIVSDHGGTLTARDREGGGAVFRARFPKEQERAGS